MERLPGHVARLQQFFTKLEGETYPEIPSELHTGISNAMIDKLLPTWGFSRGARILDIGCGQGLALTRFAAEGFAVTGITLNATDVAVCKSQGFDVQHMDQSFLEFDDASFDLVWCRHCLEHSCFPYFTLSGFRRVLKPGAWLYVEVPAPDTACAHQTNPNHYSTLGRSLWRSLITRSGFRMIEETNVTFELLQGGSDEYLVFLARVEATTP